MWAEVAAGAVGSGAALLSWGARGRSSRLFGPSIHRGPAGRRALALTFDDGPSESTPRVLELLARYGARGTFFQCGMNVERLPALAREVSLAGHEVGNHSYSHARFWLRPSAFIHDELARAQQAIAETAGAAPVLFRAPYGVRWFGMREAQLRLGLLGVMWTALGRDWKLDAGRVAARLTRAARNGAIFCLHDGRGLQPRPDIGPTLAALERLLSALRERGFRLETVSELICPKN